MQLLLSFLFGKLSQSWSGFSSVEQSHTLQEEEDVIWPSMCFLKTFVDFGFTCYSINLYCLLNIIVQNQRCDLLVVKCVRHVNMYLLCCQKFWSFPADPGSCSFGIFKRRMVFILVNRNGLIICEWVFAFLRSSWQPYSKLLSLLWSVNGNGEESWIIFVKDKR